MEAIEKLHLNDLIVVTPDVGSIKLARSYADALKVDLAIVVKRRANAKEVKMTALIGDVKDKNVLLVDDICSTGGTLCAASEACKEAGAKRIFAAVTHGLFVGEGWQESSIEKMVVANTVVLPDGIDEKRLEVVSVAPLFAMAIESIIDSTSFSSLYK